MPYVTGLVEGFQGRREEEYARNVARDQTQRQQEGKVFEYLLQSQDPEMRALAMSGLLESARPGSKAKGLRGFMGEVQGSTTYPAVLARMNEMVPEPTAPATPSSAPQPPAAPGSAAMSTNQAVRPGAAPIQTPPAGGPPQLDPEVAEMGGGGAPLGPAPGAPGAVALPPPPPPESKFKRRGTGVPTAEEVAEANARAGIEGRVKAITAALVAQGASPDQIKQAVMGIAGAPANQRTLTPVSGWGVKLPGDETVRPVLLDQNQGYVLPGGQPLPAGAEMVRMSGSAGGSVPRTAKEPDDQSPTGWSKVFYDTQSGMEMYRVPDTPFVPPPAYSGTTTFNEPGTNVPVIAPVLRGGGVGPPIGDQPGTVPSQTEGDAKALVEIVNRRLSEERRPGLPVRAGARDQITREEAQKLGLPFTSYAEAERASRSTPPVTKREAVQGGSLAERVRARALQNRGGGAVTPPTTAPAAPLPPGPSPSRSNRAQGAGPVGR